MHLFCLKAKKVATFFALSSKKSDYERSKKPACALSIQQERHAGVLDWLEKAFEEMPE
jgi:hypothetical protein